MSIAFTNILRAVATLIVILSHYFEAGLPYTGANIYTNILILAGDFGVALFFLASGYGLHQKYGQSKPDIQYINKRIKNTYFPYLLIVLFIDLYAGGFDSFRDVLVYLTGYEYWFIFEILILYIVYYIVGRITQKYRTMAVSVFIIAMSIFFALSGYKLFWYDATWVFALGMILADVLKKDTIDVRIPVLEKMGKISLYMYLLHNFVYCFLLNSAVNAGWELNWYVYLIASLIITTLMSFLVKKLIDVLSQLIERFFGKTKRSIDK